MYEYVVALSLDAMLTNCPKPQLWPIIHTLLEKQPKFPWYNMKCRGKHDTTWNIPRNITFSPVHFMLYRGKWITFGTVYFSLWLTTSRHWSTSLLVNNNGNKSQRWALEVYSLLLWLTIVNIAETVAAVREVIGSLNDSDLFGLRNDYVMYIVSHNNS